MEWQQINDSWVFGKKIRGLIRKPIASVFLTNSFPRWKWKVYIGDSEGFAESFEKAVEIVEATVEVYL